MLAMIEAWTMSPNGLHLHCNTRKTAFVSHHLWALLSPGSSKSRKVDSVRMAADDQDEPVAKNKRGKKGERGEKPRNEAQDGPLEFPKPAVAHRSSKNVTATVEKKIRVAKAQAEIDRILKGPDAPFDAESEMKKVTSVSPPVVESLAEIELEAEISQLEKDLYEAVKQQDYAKAGEAKREISQLHIDDGAAVLQVNAAFYRAFSEKNYDSMESIWLKDGTSTCIHPSSKSLVGSKAVLHSWKRMFESQDGSFQRCQMEPVDIRLTVKGASTAIVTCDEHVYSRRFVRGKKRQTELINKLTATNIFRKVAGSWRLCHHHSSWHWDSEAAKRALRGAQALSGTGNNKSRGILRKDANNAEHSEIMDGILGMSNFGPLLGTGSGEEKKIVKHIVMGNLQDILNGNLGDILGNEDGDSKDENGGTVIHFSSEDAELDDDDDDDDEDGVGSPAVVVAGIKKWENASSDSAGSEPSSGGMNGNSDSAPKDALRQDCISALRKLAVQGSISSKQKRVLLTDIISCSAKGEFSMVEVAYELLCGEGDDKDEAEEEFADQCRVFAHSLPETPSSSPT
jgi:ketosteroid isomerase-like protein